ncbi:MAG TPA: Ig-like domain repeat protein [Chthonomonadaceae bacterium]|nr:Ig-like domain repeat protein [Chthonomonadaceae bacterium]
MRKLATLWAVLVIALVSAIANAQQSYILFDLTAGSHYTQTAAYGINKQGDITGFEVLKTGAIHAFIFKNGAFQDLGLLGYQASVGIAINNADQLAADGEGPGTTALFYANGTATPIGNVDGGFSYVFGINNNGDIVGTALNGDNAYVGFSWIGGVFTDLSPLGVYRARSINDSDQLVGSSLYSWSYGGYVHTSAHGCLVSGGSFTDLGSLTGNPETNTEAYGINNAGQIVGYSTGSDNLLHAFLYSSGSMQDLGTIGSDYAIAVAINNAGQIVGILQNPYGASLGSFLYANGAMTDLSTLIARGGMGWSGLTVTAINDNGAIVGYGAVNNGSQGFLAVPAGTPLSTGLTVSSVKGQIGSATTLSALLMATTLGLPAAGATVQFSVDGTKVGAPVTTNALGQAKLKYAVPEGMAIGTHTITATFAGDAYYAASSGSGTLSLAKGPVKITVHSVTGQAGTTVTLSALLTDNDKAPLPNESLSFSVAGISVGSANTNASGVASLPYTIPSGTASGTYSILVSFAGDASHLAGSRTGTLTVK